MEPSRFIVSYLTRLNLPKITRTQTSAHLGKFLVRLTSELFSARNGASGNPSVICGLTPPHEEAMTVVSCSHHVSPILHLMACTIIGELPGCGHRSERMATSYDPLIQFVVVKGVRCYIRQARAQANVFVTQFRHILELVAQKLIGTVIGSGIGGNRG